ncbi:hypothetical protein ACYBSP_27405, partial [Klebsiella pneumoniae]
RSPGKHCIYKHWFYIQLKNYAAAFSLSTLWIFVFVKTIKKTATHTTCYSRPMPQKPAQTLPFSGLSMFY